MEEPLDNEAVLPYISTVKREGNTMVTNQQLFDEGRYIDQWNYDGWNGDVAVLVEWEDVNYQIVTARDNSAVRNPDKAAVPSLYFQNIERDKK